MNGKQPREDAVLTGSGVTRRWFVPTIWGQPTGNTEYVQNWDEFRKAGGVICFSEDQTEITLTLPAGWKFGIKFQEGNENQPLVPPPGGSGK